MYGVFMRVYRCVRGGLVYRVCTGGGLVEVVGRGLAAACLPARPCHLEMGLAADCRLLMYFTPSHHEAAAHEACLTPLPLAGGAALITWQAPQVGAVLLFATPLLVAMARRAVGASAKVAYAGQRASAAALDLANERVTQVKIRPHDVTPGGFGQ